MMFFTVTTSGSLAVTGIVSMSSRVSTTSARTLQAKASRVAEAVPVAIRISRCMRFSSSLVRRRRFAGTDFVQSHLQVLAHCRVELGSLEKGAHCVDGGVVGREQRIGQSDLQQRRILPLERHGEARDDVRVAEIGAQRIDG